MYSNNDMEVRKIPLNQKCRNSKEISFFHHTQEKKPKQTGRNEQRID